MTLEIIRNAFGWCAIINIAFLFFWFLMFACCRDWIYSMHNRWFKMPKETFNAIHYAGIATYKIAIFLLNLVPYIALRIVG
ncbi:MAG: DUF6868 family protein [Verrucomicrobiota bacterium]